MTTINLNSRLVYYLASPYTSKKTGQDKLKEQYNRYTLITDVAARLTAFYHLTLICPITTSHNLKNSQPDLLGTNWNFWKDVDTLLISKSDGLLVVTMKNWKNSIGVQAEIKLAKSFKIPVYYVNPKNLDITRTP